MQGSSVRALISLLLPFVDQGKEWGGRNVWTNFCSLRDAFAEDFNLDVTGGCVQRDGHGSAA